VTEPRSKKAGTRTPRPPREQPAARSGTTPPERPNPPADTEPILTDGSTSMTYNYENRFFNEPRLRDMMDRREIDILILREVENTKYISKFFHQGGRYSYRPFVVFYFRDPAKGSAMIVPAVDLHLEVYSTWINDVRAYAMSEFFTYLNVHFHEDFFDAARATSSCRCSGHVHRQSVKMDGSQSDKVGT
jgi:hypothetical protein